MSEDERRRPGAEALKAQADAAERQGWTDIENRGTPEQPDYWGRPPLSWYPYRYPISPPPPEAP